MNKHERDEMRRELLECRRWLVAMGERKSPLEHARARALAASAGLLVWIRAVENIPRDDPIWRAVEGLAQACRAIGEYKDNEQAN